MLSLILAGLAGALTGAGETVVVTPPERPGTIVWRKTCNAGLARTATVTSVELRRLGELPPGMLQLAVDKRVEGCSVTVLPRRDETGQHMMLMGPTPRPQLVPTDRRSEPKRRLQRHR